MYWLQKRVFFKESAASVISSDPPC